MRQFVFFLAALVVLLSDYAESHARLLNPISRASRWRKDSKAPRDYNDNQGFCGGFWNQHFGHDGKCGICGDDYGDETPRLHELGGVYGAGVIVAKYLEASLIQITIDVTANHWGHFRFDLCNLDENNGHETEKCFKHVVLADGRPYYNLASSATGLYNTTLRLPKGQACKHCVLRWTYHTGNSWGDCGDGTGALGCGPQENFRACSDVMIFPLRYSQVNVQRTGTQFNHIQHGNTAEGSGGMPSIHSPPSQVVENTEDRPLQFDMYVPQEPQPPLVEASPYEEFDGGDSGLPEAY